MNVIRSLVGGVLSITLFGWLAGCASQPVVEETPLDITTQRCCTNLLNNGNFEEGVGAYPEASIIDGQKIGSAWTVHFVTPSTVGSVALFANSYSNNVYQGSGPNQLLWKTPDGKHFVEIGMNADGQPTGNFPDYPPLYISQPVNVAAGVNYRLAFLQSGWRYPYGDPGHRLTEIPGRVQVQLVAAADTANPVVVYSEHFKVCPGSKWLAQGDKIRVPANAAGPFELRFLNDNPKDVAVVDGIWLCEDTADK